MAAIAGRRYTTYLTTVSVLPVLLKAVFPPRMHAGGRMQPACDRMQAAYSLHYRLNVNTSIG